MNGPLRLRDSVGAARVLMGGSGLNVPSASRRRALTFVGTAATGTAVSGSAVAATTTALVKGVVLCVCLGALGGGLASLAVSETFSRFEARPATAQAPAPTRAVTRVAPSAPLVVVPEATEPAPEAAPAAAAERAATRDARPSAPPAAVNGAAAAPASSKSLPAPSLFEEQRIIESARAAVARGDTASALATLDGYERAYAQGQFGPEALGEGEFAVPIGSECECGEQVTAQHHESHQAQLRIPGDGPAAARTGATKFRVVLGAVRYA